MTKDEEFQQAMKSALDTLTVKPGNLILYFDKIVAIAECYNAPYYLCKFPDGTALMMPKDLIKVKDVEAMMQRQKELDDGNQGETTQASRTYIVGRSIKADGS